MSAIVRHGTATLRLALTVNSRPIEADVEPRQNLADVVRDTLNLTGTHLGCEHGVCGACTLLIDGEPARSCLTFAGTCEGAEITTIEGLDADEIATELRAAFNRNHALQCGYCMPGMLITARDLVLRLPEADERRIRLGLSGNLCRCTGYVGIVRAIMEVIAARRDRGVAARVSVEGRGCGPVGAHRSAVPAGAGVPPTPVHDVARKPAPPVSTRPSGGAADFSPAHRFEQSVAIDISPAEVFAAFGRIAEVAACVPGAVIDALPTPDRVEGGITVKLGPIAATFRGTARIERFEDRREGRILAMGADAGERSMVQGEIRYRVLPGPDPDRSRVALTIGYTLKGPLAQFGRPGLVRDVAARLGSVFATNLEARLKGETPPAASAQLDLPRLLWASLWSWIGRLRGRGGDGP